jgi:proteasome lid subunit RPN8/RPN11
VNSLVEHTNGTTSTMKIVDVITARLSSRADSGNIMNKKIIKKDLNRIIRTARNTARNDHHEICGLLIDNGHFLEILETRNTSKRGGHFEFDGKQIRKIMKSVKDVNHEIVGTFHSHPLYYPKPGVNDIKWAVDDSLMLIIDCIDQEATLWHIKDKKARAVKYKVIEL